jgi:hypothetical protein
MSKRKNPGAQNLQQWLKALSTVCTRKNEKAGFCSRSHEPEVLAAKKLIDATPASKRSEFAREQASKRRRNPDAADLYESFHGKPATKETIVEEELHAPTKLADLGSLIELQVVLRDGVKLAEIGFRGRGVRVAASGSGKELHLVGGSQALELAELGCNDQAGKPNVLIGVAHKITYRTSKHFHDFVPSDYEHEFGEDTGVKPLLCYDPRSRKLYLVGGAYEIRPEGIVN